MKPKTTLNLLKDFFSNGIQKVIFLLQYIIEKKIWSDTFNIPYTLSAVSYSSLTFLKPVFEITSVETDQNKIIKSAPPEIKYYYRLQNSFF